MKDLKTVLKHIQEDGEADFLKEYGYFQVAPVGTIMKNILIFNLLIANH
jgi:hypothetical protein